MNSLPIFVINLDKRTDRWAFVSSNLKRLNLFFERVSAVDGNDESMIIPLVNNNKFEIHTGRKVTKGELGCAESHRSIWRRMVENNIEFALILEDDVDFDESLNSLITSNFYSTFDFVNLSYAVPYKPDKEALVKLCHEGIVKRPLLFSKWKKVWAKIEGRKKVFHLTFLEKGNAVCECDPAPILASGYILSLQAAKFFLKETNILCFPIDYTWRYCSGMLRQGFLVNSVVRQALDETSIIGRKESSENNFWFKVKRFLLRNRRIKRRLDLIRMHGFRYL